MVILSFDGCYCTREEVPCVVLPEVLKNASALATITSQNTFSWHHLTQLPELMHYYRHHVVILVAIRQSYIKHEIVSSETSTNDRTNQDIVSRMNIANM